jgi:hypothetical protein
VPHEEAEQPQHTKQKPERRLSSTLRVDEALLEKVFIQSRMDTIDVEYEWFNYTLAQFWHTYDAWLGQFIRMLIEKSIGNMRFCTLEVCTLGQVRFFTDVRVLIHRQWKYPYFGMTRPGILLGQAALIALMCMYVCARVPSLLQI